MRPRHHFQGVWTVVSFNWTIYLSALIILLSSIILFGLPSPAVKLIAGFSAAGTLWFLLGASYWVYDRSKLYHWGWLKELSPQQPLSILVCHTGFDEASEAIRHRFPESTTQVLDHFDPERMPERSIRRARVKYPPKPNDCPAPFNLWPDYCADLVLAPLSIHELRSEKERIAWLSEARRSLLPGGKIIVIEHLRDLANFAAFGPGFVHFHSGASWRRCWETAGCMLNQSFRITPFVHVFILTCSPP